MPSTYTTNGGIELPANGEQSGTWGETVNDNMAIIDRLTNGVGAVSLSGTTHTLTTTDGTLSDGQYNVLVLGGSPSGTNTITISPNDGEHVYIVKNASGQTATFTQGSGANVSVLNNTTKIIYADGAGAGAAVVDITGALDLGSLIIAGTTIITAVLDEDNMASDSATALATQQSIKAYVDAQVDTVDTLAEILAIGNTTGATDIAVDSAQKVQFRDAAIYINSSVDGQLDIVADTEIQIAATTIDVNGALDVSGTALVTGVLTTTAATVSNGGGQFNGAINVGVDDTGYDVKFFGATAGAYMLWDESADDLILGGAAGLSVNSTALVTGVLTTTAATVFNGGFASNADSTLGGSLTVNGPRVLVQRANDDSSIAFANNASGSPSSHVWATGLNYSNSNAFSIAYGSGGIPSLDDAKLVIDVSGNVGIGATSITQPSAGATTLKIKGTDNDKAGAIYLESANVSVVAYIYPDSANGLSINTSTSHPIIFRTVGTERMRIDSSGNVGIGTSSPERLLHVKAGGPTYVRIESTSASQNAMLDIKSTVATWSIGQNAVKTDGSFEFYNGSSTPIFFTTSGAVTVGADLTLTNGNLVVAAGKGIDFSATAGTGTSELLDDYEEGTWTPTVQGATTAGTYTLSGTTAKYTKVGNQVTVWGFFGFSAASGGTSYAVIGSLPFTYAAGAGVFGAVRADSFNFTTANPASLVVAATTGVSGTTLNILELRDNAGPVDAPISGVSTSTLIGFTVTYSV
jgi:hypothetical protein